MYVCFQIHMCFKMKLYYLIESKGFISTVTANHHGDENISDHLSALRNLDVDFLFVFNNDIWHGVTVWSESIDSLADWEFLLSNSFIDDLLCGLEQHSRNFKRDSCTMTKLLLFDSDSIHVLSISGALFFVFDFSQLVHSLLSLFLRQWRHQTLLHFFCLSLSLCPSLSLYLRKSAWAFGLLEPRVEKKKKVPTSSVSGAAGYMVFLLLL